MRFASLGSGSEGNALLVEVSEGVSTTRILLDCGFSMREIERRLAARSVDVASLDAIVITHEHADHIGSALSLTRKYRIPLIMSWGTGQAVKAHASLKSDDEVALVRWCRSDERLAVGGVELHPYTVPHDAREPLQFVFSDGARRLGVLTDAGCPTAHLITTLGGCDALVLECNHDREMLANSKYPPSLKARIGGTYGHLANDAAAEILGAIDRAKLQRVICAHLSEQNNTPELAMAAMAAVIGTEATEILVATQAGGFDWLTC
ncbi:MBL fold metallo-hydrolase [Pandoraea pulmonicola]|uniref:MBL fold metallo-hydrolase n=1 Tax=Pandoraea pulmonicola TaxID=93221 RepID=A0AAJ4Z9D7_PANPU|nr:MBL fold metallo-hydrolase [Pandoraea pulmonicola]AJC21893.1 MBL fold metallo-hydrolase [Pandoraea pulmonicola]SUA89169.1 ribonuclease Z [Pandoraea pulmonicola]